jgi:two-component system, OmpR family, alkaline phosphatase synthesis response regulator PhoP
MKILVIDDEEHLLEVLSVGFHFQWPDATILTARSGAAGLKLFEEHNPDVLILDVAMPDLNGFDVLRAIRRVSDVPVLMLSARGEEVDHVRGLESGADDYLTKPFSPLALMAHIKAVLRRAELPAPGEALAEFVADELSIDFDKHVVRVAGQPVALTPVEYRLLYHLARNAGRLMPGQALMDRVWGSTYGAVPHDLRVAMSRLRRKIEPPGTPSHIHTERGLGYRFVNHR